MKRAKPKHLEEAEQVALIDWVDALRPVAPILDMLYHVPNGGARVARIIKGKRISLEAIRLKRMGARAGVFDLNLDVATPQWHGLRLEMKYGDGKLSSEQRTWLIRWRRQGYFPAIAYTWTQAARVIVDYLTPSLAVSPSELNSLRRALPWGA